MEYLKVFEKAEGEAALLALLSQCFRKYGIYDLAVVENEDALAVIFTKLVNNHDIEFDVLHTDITADEDMTVKYIEERIDGKRTEVFTEGL